MGSAIQERSWEWDGDWLDWDWEAGRREQESLVGSRGTPHPVAVGFPAIPTSIPCPIPTGRGMPWPFPRLANLASKVLSSTGLLLETEKALQRSKSRAIPKLGRFPWLSVNITIHGIDVVSFMSERPSGREWETVR